MQMLLMWNPKCIQVNTNSAVMLCDVVTRVLCVPLMHTQPNDHLLSFCRWWWWGWGGADGVSLCVVWADRGSLAVSRVPRFLPTDTHAGRLLRSPCLFPICVCLFSFLVISHPPLSVSQPHIFFLFIVSLSARPFFCLFLSPPPFLSSVSCAFSLVKSNFPLYLVKRHMFFSTYSRPFVLLHQQSIGPYKEMIQRTQTASEKCLADDLLQCTPHPSSLSWGFIWPARPWVSICCVRRLLWS